jgi:hypothetical protein
LTFRRLPRTLRRYERVRVIVNTPDASIRGVLTHVHRDHLVLAQAQHLEGAPGQKPVAIEIAGEAVVPRRDVSWIQVLPPSEELT